MSVTVAASVPFHPLRSAFRAVPPLLVGELDVSTAASFKRELLD